MAAPRGVSALNPWSSFSNTMHSLGATVRPQTQLPGGFYGDFVNPIPQFDVLGTQFPVPVNLDQQDVVTLGPMDAHKIVACHRATEPLIKANLRPSLHRFGQGVLHPAPAIFPPLHPRSNTNENLFSRHTIACAGIQLAYHLVPLCGFPAHENCDGWSSWQQPASVTHFSLGFALTTEACEDDTIPSRVHRIRYEKQELVKPSVPFTSPWVYTHGGRYHTFSAKPSWEDALQTESPLIGLPVLASRLQVFF
ncbi:hypothetical protein B0T14DRAFT_327832 [Immersiella caudata]|uniref:Uncharacterized protein n=1 Tax=Immersiella caudata TaxID=314043 RepID=A0AA39U5I7_9PEZI|nr:hypothetical protein B0T14DRAFT_327832 [Immersiella caudata]